MDTSLLDRCLALRCAHGANTPPEFQSRWTEAEPATTRVPTLAPGIYKPLSPMLAVRFGHFGRWLHATHGDWLTLSDMEARWAFPIADLWLNGMEEMRRTAEQHWANDAAALFRPDRLTFFAGSDLTNERMYLLWLDFEDEPEVWAYDSNGESRYRSLESYLQAYLAGDISAAEHRWRAID